MERKNWVINKARNVSLDAVLWPQLEVNANQEVWYPSPRPAMLICPGGGYSFISQREGQPVGAHFYARGYQVFILNYSVGKDSVYPNPWVDASRAVRFIRSHAADFDIDPDNICVAGFSAGGHIAAWLGSSFDDDKLCAAEKAEVADKEFYEGEAQALTSTSNRPDHIILGYAVVETDLDKAGIPKDITPQKLAEVLGYTPGALILERNPETSLPRRVTEKHPRTFMWLTATDQIVPAQQTLYYAKALLDHNVECEVHMFPRGLHGLASADKLSCADGRDVPASTSTWIDLAELFLSAGQRAPRTEE